MTTGSINFPTKFQIYFPLLLLNFVCVEWKFWLMVFIVALEEQSIIQNIIIEKWHENKLFCNNF